MILSKANILKTALIYGVSAVVAFGYGYSKGSSSEKKQFEIYRLAKESEISELERLNSEIKERVIIKYVDRVKTITKKELVFIDSSENLVPQQHNLSNGWVHVHDSSIKEEYPEEILASDSLPSKYTDIDALSTVISNYSVCQQNAEQLKSLQEWVSETRRIVNE